MESYCYFCGCVCDTCTLKILYRLVNNKNGQSLRVRAIVPICLDCADKSIYDKKEFLK